MLRLLGLLFVAFFLLELQHAPAQSGDSLIIALSKSDDNPEEKAELLIKLGALYLRKYPKESIYYSEQLLTLSQKHQRTDWAYAAHMHSGVAQISLGNPDKATFHLLTASELAAEDKTEKGTKNRLKARLNLQGLNLSMGDVDEAISMGRQNIKDALLLKDSLLLADCYSAISSAFNNGINPDSSLLYIQKAIGLYEKLNQPEKLCQALNTKAIVYNILGNNVSAESTLLLSEKIAKEANLDFFLERVYILLAETYLAQGKTDKAQNIITQAYKDLYTKENLNLGINYHELLSKIYQYKQMTDSAVFHLKKAFDLKREILNEQKLSTVYELEKVYETRQRTLENKLLREDKEKMNRSNRILFSSLLVSFLLFVLVGILYLLLKRKHKELSALHEQAASINKRLLTLLDERQTITQLITHHLRTPLIIIQLQARELFKTDTEITSELRKKALETIDKATEDIHNASMAIMQMQHDVDILEDINFESFDVRSLIKEVVQELDSLASTRHIKLALKNPRSGMQVSANKMLTRQILYNIISNAIEYGTDHDTVNIHLERTENVVMIQINDHGPGIEPDVLRTLFTGRQYTQSGPTYRGNGLYLSRRFAQKMKGDLSIESNLNEGTKVTVTLPSAQS